MTNKPYTKVQDDERHFLVSCSVNDEHIGGCEHFNYLSAENLRKCIEKGYVDRSERQNGSPRAEDFCEFLEANPEFHAHGYIIANTRDDRRITIEGVESNTMKTPEVDLRTLTEWLDFIMAEDENISSPDECDIYSDKAWCWWD